MSRILLETQGHATHNAVRELRHLLQQVSKDAVPDIQIQHKMLLCFSEAATNLVMHTKPKTKQIGIIFGSNNSEWWIDILDNAAPWNPTEKVKTDFLDTFSDAGNGRGTAILQSQCDHIEYIDGDEHKNNQLRLIWHKPNKSRRRTVLIVEDDHSLQRLYSAYLAENYDVITAADGYEAMERLAHTEIDLILSDINMPEMSGLTLREHLSKQCKTELIPFIVLTCVNSPNMQKDAADLGIDDYLLKPINKTQLIQTIDRVINRSQQIYRQLTDRIDKKITSALKPNLPETIHGWRLCVASRHTGVGGGDLLLHRNGDNQLMLVLVDIMGHDDSAKFFAYAYGGYLRGLMHTSDDDVTPTQLLEKLSESALQDELLSQVILTCCAVTLSQDGKITLASAGHPEPLKLSGTKAEKIQVSGMLPGLIADTHYKPKNIELDAGERIALYTDGLFESAVNNKARKYLEAHITNELINTLTAPIEQSLQKVMEVFDQYAGTQPKDDALLLLMEPKR